MNCSYEWRRELRKPPLQTSLLLLISLKSESFFENAHECRERSSCQCTHVFHGHFRRRTSPPMCDLNRNVAPGFQRIGYARFVRKLSITDRGRRRRRRRNSRISMAAATLRAIRTAACARCTGECARSHDRQRCQCADKVGNPSHKKPPAWILWIK